MAILKEVDFVDGVTPVSAAWLDLIQEVLASYVSPNFKVEQASSTTIRVPAGNNHSAVGIAIGGQFRRRDTNVTASVSGGAGTKIVYATADSSDDVFALEVTAGTPAATNVRKIAEVDWSGTAIEEIRNEYPLVPPAPGEFPIGGGMFWFTGTPPAGFVALDGAAISRSTYADLFALWGTSFGAGNGSTTFNVPDTRQRMPIGLGAGGTASAIGEVGGQIDHVHTGPSHQHSGPSHAHSGPSHAHSVNPPSTNTGGPTSILQDRWPSVASGFAPDLPSVTHAHAINIGTFNTGNAGTGQTGSGGTGLTGASGTGNTGPQNQAYITVLFVVRAL